MGNLYRSRRRRPKSVGLTKQSVPLPAHQHLDTSEDLLPPDHDGATIRTASESTTKGHNGELSPRSTGRTVIRSAVPIFPHAIPGASSLTPNRSSNVDQELAGPQREVPCLAALPSLAMLDEQQSTAVTISTTSSTEGQIFYDAMEYSCNETTSRSVEKADLANEPQTPAQLEFKAAKQPHSRRTGNGPSGTPNGSSTAVPVSSILATRCTSPSTYVVPSDPALASHKTGRRALLVGINYKHCSTENRCKYCPTQDVRHFADRLMTLGYPNESVRVVTNELDHPPASCEYLMECIDWLIQTISEGDRLLFMFSGNYITQEGLYIVAGDSESIRWATIQERLVTKVPSKAELTILMDRCEPTGTIRWKYSIGRIGESHKLKQTSMPEVLSELKLPPEQYIPITDDLPPQPSKISRTMAISEVVDCLLRHNCQDITSELDFERCSLQSIFRGGFGMIHKGTLHNGKPVAIKCVEALGSWGAWELGEKSLTHSAREIYAWSKCDHEFILPVLGFAQYREYILLVSPWMKNGTLASYISQHPRCNRLQLSVELSLAVAHMHDKGIIHGDIKADNVVISNDGHVQLVDFGSAILVGNHSLNFTQTGFKGTWRFTAPELHNQTIYTHTIKSDIYSLGMVILHMMSGTLPFADEEDRVIPIKIMKGHIPRRPNFSKTVANLTAENGLWILLNQCWAFEPKNRPTAIEVKEALIRLEPFAFSDQLE